MHIYFTVLGRQIPAYGAMAALGLVSANAIAIVFLRKYKLDLNDFIILEAYALLGAFLGSKLLYLGISWGEIDWSKMAQPEYFSKMMQGGFVFYGGLFGGVGMLILAGRIHNIAAGNYIRKILFLIPWIHGFGRIGCFLAGCCYGKPYQGRLGIIYPASSLAPAGVSLFPVQLMEAVGLFVLAVVLLWYTIRGRDSYTWLIYIIGYGAMRFVLEYMRYDKARGELLGLSTSQWISIGMLAVTACYIIKKRFCSC